ncbi:unnamed protein product, partial [Acanthoscelides obtectus]
EYYEVGDDRILSPISERPESGLSDHIDILQGPCSSGTHKRGTSSSKSGSSIPKRMRHLTLRCSKMYPLALVAYQQLYRKAELLLLPQQMMSWLFLGYFYHCHLKNQLVNEL